jgi:hypothetical protein
VRDVTTVNEGSYATDEDGTENSDASWLVAGPEIIISVAPTLQCAGYMGIAYANTSLYIVGDGVDSTRDDGGCEVNEVSVWQCKIVSPDKSYIDKWNALERVMRSGW